MCVCTRFALLLLLAAPGHLSAQAVDEVPWRATPSVGVFAGLGSGPIDAAAWGVEASVPLWRFLAVTAEYSGWGNGVGGTACIHMPPYSHRCSVSGWAGLVGVAAIVPVEGPLGVFAEISGGRFTRDWMGDDKVNSRALSLEAGAQLRIHGRLSARLGGRFLRAFDGHYEALLEEDLQYTMGTFGLEYGLAW